MILTRTILKTKHKVYRSGGYGFMMTLDKRTCIELGIGLGTMVEQWKHPTQKDVMCIRVIKK